MAIIVKRKKGESKDDIIGKFRRLCLEEDITEEVRKRAANAKPSIGRYAKKKIILCSLIKNHKKSTISQLNSRKCYLFTQDKTVQCRHRKTQQKTREIDCCDKEKENDL